MNRKSSMTMAPSAASCNIINITWRLNSQTKDYTNKKKRRFHNASSALGEITTQSQNSFNSFSSLGNSNEKVTLLKQNQNVYLEHLLQQRNQLQQKQQHFSLNDNNRSLAASNLLVCLNNSKPSTSQLSFASDKMIRITQIANNSNNATNTGSNSQAGKPKTSLNLIISNNNHNITNNSNIKEQYSYENTALSQFNLNSNSTTTSSFNRAVNNNSSTSNSTSLNIPSTTTAHPSNNLTKKHMAKARSKSELNLKNLGNNTFKQLLATNSMNNGNKSKKMLNKINLIEQQELLEQHVNQHQQFHQHYMQQLQQQNSHQQEQLQKKEFQTVIQTKSDFKIKLPQASMITANDVAKYTPALLKENSGKEASSNSNILSSFTKSQGIINTVVNQPVYYDMATFLNPSAPPSRVYEFSIPDKLKTQIECFSAIKNDYKTLYGYETVNDYTKYWYISENGYYYTGLV